MLVDEGALRQEDGRWISAHDFSAGVALPASIDSLLAARLDLLPNDELLVAESASVIGLTFATGPVGELLPDAVGEIDQRLARIEARRLVHRVVMERREPWYRFQHILVRDSAYNRVPKRTRSGLHSRFADWAERVNRERGRELEFQEISAITWSRRGATCSSSRRWTTRAASSVARGRPPRPGRPPCLRPRRHDRCLEPPSPHRRLAPERLP